MTKLKTNWAIRTTDEQFKAYILTLEALGYNTHYARLSYAQEVGRFNWLFQFTPSDSVDTVPVGRAVLSNETSFQFPDISSFLVYHFSSEKT